MSAYFLMIPLLLLIVYHDFKYRYINLWVLVLFLISAVMVGVQSIGVVDVFKNVLLNCSFVGLQLILVSVYFSIKTKGWINITEQQIGWGDILFFLPLSCLMAPEWFVFFYILSLILILMFYLIFKMVFKLKNQTIPLAGSQALCLIVLGMMKWLVGFNPYERFLF